MDHAAVKGLWLITSSYGTLVNYLSRRLWFTSLCWNLESVPGGWWDHAKQGNPDPVKTAKAQSQDPRVSPSAYAEQHSAQAPAGYLVCDEG